MGVNDGIMVMVIKQELTFIAMGTLYIEG